MKGIFTFIANMSYMASFAILAVWLIRLILKKAPKIFSYLLWSVVLFRLLCPFSIQTPVGFIRTGTEPAPVIDSAIDFTPPRFEEEPTYEIQQNGQKQPQNYIQTPTPQTKNLDLINIISYIWLAGVFAFMLYAVISYWHLKRKMKNAIRKIKGVYESDCISTPFVLGMFRPKIYMPLGLGQDEFCYIVEHEKTHIKRRDYLIKTLAFIVASVYWFNPLVWISYILMCRDMEMSCDERVLKKYCLDIRKEYSSSLLSLSIRQSGLFVPLAFGEMGVKARIKNVLNYKKTAFGLSVAAVLLVVIAIVCIGTNAKIDNTKPGMVSSGGTASEPISEGEIKTAIASMNYLCYDDLNTGFSQPDQISVSHIFNFYTTTSAVQKQLKDLDYKQDEKAAVRLENFRIFAEKYFGKCSFTAEELQEQFTAKRILAEVSGENILLAHNYHYNQRRETLFTQISITNLSSQAGKTVAQARLVTGNESVHTMEIVLQPTNEGYHYQAVHIRQIDPPENMVKINVSYWDADMNKEVEEIYFKEQLANKINLLNNEKQLILSAQDIQVLPYVFAEQQQNGKYVLIDKHTNKAVSNEHYNEVWCQLYPDKSLASNYMLVRKNEYWGITDGKGNIILPPEKYQLDTIELQTYEEIWPVIAVQRGDKWGVIDYNGNMVVEPAWKWVYMDVYNHPNILYVYDGINWGEIKLDITANEVGNRQIKGTSAVNFSVSIPQEIIDSYYSLHPNK